MEGLLRAELEKRKTFLNYQHDVKGRLLSTYAQNVRTSPRHNYTEDVEMLQKQHQRQLLLLRACHIAIYKKSQTDSVTHA